MFPNEEFSPALAQPGARCYRELLAELLKLSAAAS
jgi:hypothetical protein